MDINDFISNYKNHPVLFIGTGVSLRYLKNSYTWDGLLASISLKLKGNSEYYYDIKSKCEINGKYDYPRIASMLEKEFNDVLQSDRNGDFEEVNDVFYENMRLGVNVSRFKIYISSILKSIEFRSGVEEEISELKKSRKNIGSIITTNYDNLIEHIFDFQPLIGNDILLSNPYGSVYKIHGCVTNPLKIIISEDDYSYFDKKYELIRAQLLSIFIHNPIVFLGYSIADENIKSILKTIFTYVEPNSDQAEKIRNNFLLVEYEEGSSSRETKEHDIDLEGFSTIRINKIKTDDFSSVYRAISNLSLPVSAMDVRKVQNVFKEISSGGSIAVNITEDLDSIDNKDKIIAIGSINTIKYHYQTISEMMMNYFKIIEESNHQLLSLINKQKIQKNQYFPSFAFSKICSDINDAGQLQEQQISKVTEAYRKADAHPQCHTDHTTIEDIMNDDGITQTYKSLAILWSMHNRKIELSDVESYLIGLEDKKNTNYRMILCMYDFLMYK